MALSAEYLPDTDESIVQWGHTPASGDWFDKIDEYKDSVDTADYTWAQVSNSFIRHGIETPSESVGIVSIVRVYFAFLGALVGASDMSLLIYIYGNGSLKGFKHVDSDTGSAITYAYVDIDVSDFSQAEFDDMEIGFRHFVDTGHAYDPPEPQV